MKKKLNYLNLKNKGFATLLTIILLPLLLFILSAVSCVVVVTAFKAEFQYICIQESLKLQNKVLNQLKSRVNFNKDLLNMFIKNETLAIAKKLMQIKSAVVYQNLSFKYPIIENENNLNLLQSLAFNLDYKFINSYQIKCGFNLIKESSGWKSEIIY